MHLKNQPIECGSFNLEHFLQLKNATILKDALSEEKINNVQIDQVFKNGKMIYYVRSNHFNSYDKALNQSKKLKNKTKFTISGF